VRVEFGAIGSERRFISHGAPTCEVRVPVLPRGFSHSRVAAGESRLDCKIESPRARKSALLEYTPPDLEHCQLNARLQVMHFGRLTLRLLDCRDPMQLLQRVLPEESLRSDPRLGAISTMCCSGRAVSQATHRAHHCKRGPIGAPEPHRERPSLHLSTVGCQKGG
jgi:hypothetical protein